MKRLMLRTCIKETDPASVAGAELTYTNVSKDVIILVFRGDSVDPETLREAVTTASASLNRSCIGVLLPHGLEIEAYEVDDQADPPPVTFLE